MPKLPPSGMLNQQLVEVLSMPGLINKWEVKRLLEAGADPKARGFPEGMPLFISAERSDREVCEMLLEAGALVNEKDEAGLTPLLKVGPKGSLVMVEFLISKGARLDARSGKGDSILHLAAASGYRDNILFFLEHGFSVNAPDSEGNSPLHLAAKSGNVNGASALLDSGANPNTRNGEGKTPLQVAYKNGRYRFLDFLAPKCADRTIPWTDEEKLWNLIRPLENACNRTEGKIAGIIPEIRKCATSKMVDSMQEGELLLTMVIRLGLVEIAQVLLEIGANPNGIEGVGCPPLHCAAGWTGDPEGGECRNLGVTMTNLLLTWDADPNLLDAFGETPLFPAVRADNGVSKSLLENGARVNTSNHAGRTPLHFAVENSRGFQGETLVTTDQTALLLEYGADVNARDSQGNTPLRGALGGNIRLLLEHGADPNSVNSSGTSIMDSLEPGELKSLLIKAGGIDSRVDSAGRTPLHIAAMNSSAKSLERALELKKFPVDAPDSRGRTPLMIGAGKGCAEVVSVLLGRGANPNLLDQDTCSSLHHAVFGKSPRVIELLLKAGAAINQKSREGLSPLMDAVRLGYPRIVECLLENLARTDFKDEDGNTLLHLGVVGESEEVVKLLLEKGMDRNSHNAYGKSPSDLAEEKGLDKLSKLLNPSKPWWKPW